MRDKFLYIIYEFLESCGIQKPYIINVGNVVPTQYWC